MKLYYSPGACSLASHIVLLETGAKFEIEAVNLRAKTYSGGDFTKLNPKGYIPALQLDSGEILTEGAVIMQYVADQNPSSGVVPKAGTMERYRCQEWLNYIATEVHRGYTPLWSPQTPDAYKAMVKENLAKRFVYLSGVLGKQSFLMGEQFTAADAYLFTVLSWSKLVDVDLSGSPVLLGYIEKVQARPSVQAAMKAEGLLK